MQEYFVMKVTDVKCVSDRQICPEHNVNLDVAIPSSSFIIGFIIFIWGRQDPGGPHVGPVNFAIWEGWQSVSGHGQVIAST